MTTPAAETQAPRAPLPSPITVKPVRAESGRALQVKPAAGAPSDAVPAPVPSPSSHSTHVGTTATAPHAVAPKATVPRVGPSPQRAAGSKAPTPLRTRTYNERQRDILRRGRLAGQGERPSQSPNPLHNGLSADCLDSEGRPKHLQATATVRRVKRDSDAAEKALLPVWLARLVLLIVQVIILALLIAAVAVPVFKSKDTAVKAKCYNFWGRYECGSWRYAVKGTSTWGCSSRSGTMRASLVFGLFGVSLSFIMVVVLVLKYFLKSRTFNVLLFGFTFLNSLFLMLAFALIAVVHNVPFCDNRRPSALVQYGPSMPLFIVAWVLTLANLVLLFFISV